MSEKGNVRFIRVNGRVVPVRGDGGRDLRSKYSASNKDRAAAMKEARSHTRNSTKKLLKMKAGEFGAGAFLGAQFGALVGLLGNTKKSVAIGAATGALALGALAASASRSEYVSNRQYNKSLGKRLARKR
jgi:uncharacterized membrane protein